MRATLALALLLLVPGAAALEPSPLQFASPGGFGPAAEIDGSQWMVLVFSPASIAEAELDAQGSAILTNHTRSVVVATVPPTTEPAGEGPSDDRSESVELSPTSLSFGNGRAGSLWIFAQSIVLNATAFEAAVQPKPIDESVGLAKPPNESGRFVFRNHAAPDGDAMIVLSTPGVPATFNVEVVGLSRMEWYGASISCSSSCLPGGGSQTTSSPSAGDAGITYTERSYIELQPPPGSILNVEGTLDYALLGGPSLDIAVDGWLRLPGASGAGNCACIDPSNQTLHASGHLMLAHVHTEDGRMAGTLSGELGSAHFDERTVDVTGFSAVRMAGPGLAVAGGVVGLVWLGLLLFTRFSKSEALGHPNRKLLYDAVLSSPGINFRELSRQTGVAAGTARYHLTVLTRSGLVVEKPHHNVLRFFENHGRFEATWNRVGVLRDPALRELHEWALAHGACAQKDILDAMESEHGWSRSTTQHRLARLVADGLLCIRLRGRFKVYEAGTVEAPRPPGILLPPATGIP